MLILFVVLAVVFARAAALHPFGRGLYAIGLNTEAAHFSGVERRAHQADRCSSLTGAVVGARRHLLHAALRQRPRRQRHRARAAGHRRGAARRRVDLRRPRHAARRPRRRPADRRALAAPCAWRTSRSTSSTSSPACCSSLSVVVPSVSCAWLDGSSAGGRGQAPGPGRVPGHAESPASEPTKGTITMKIPSRRGSAPSRALARERSALLTSACGGSSANGGSRRRPAAPAATPRDHVPAQEPRQPVLRHQRQGRQDRGRGVRRHVQGGRPGPRPAPTRRCSYINTAAQQGVERARRLGQRPERDLRRAQPGPRRRRQGRHLRLRHQARLPRPVRQPGHRRGHRQDAGRHDRRADRRRRRDRDPVGHRQRDEPERLDRDDEGGAGRRTTRTSSSSRSSTATTTTRSRSTRPRRCCSVPEPQGHHLARPRSASPRRPATCPTRSTRARSR